MAIQVKIRQRGFFHKIPLELEDLTGTVLEYGTMDFGYRLVPRDTEGLLVLYDPEHIGCGMEATFEENLKDQIELRVPDFGTKYDIALLYGAVERICRKWDTEEFEQNGRKASLQDIPDLKEEAEAFHLEYFRKIRNLMTDDVMTVAAVMWPVRIPAEKLEDFGVRNDAEGYAKYLHECQDRDLYYALPVVYQSRKTGEFFGVYAISSGTGTILSPEPEVPATVGLPRSALSSFSVSLVSLRDKKVLSTVRWEDFMAEISPENLERYDDLHVILPGLSEERMAEIAAKYPPAELPAQ